jgi:hypothetical protein
MLSGITASIVGIIRYNRKNAKEENSATASDPNPSN